MPIYRKPTKKHSLPPDYQGFPCDGLWLVQSNPHGKSSFCIEKISEVPQPYPFAQMAVSAQSLCDFLGTLEKRAQEKTGTYKEIKPGVKTLVSWSMPSRFDTALAILKWLSEQEGDGRSIGLKSMEAKPTKKRVPVKDRPWPWAGCITGCPKPMKSMKKKKSRSSEHVPAGISPWNGCIASYPRPW